ncbi:GTPase-activating protein isoform X2 [Scaptodrosophila lebanonensis]|uniref:GTPase-activating protein isoform X2 n=1 Tax=Drosophila lebanonensis TaxID=7225 RepID=A0A6J2TAD1_DROLE|nr:GTPase-activating protein isoform X2 [Scaptodrosophila lebanonensis]
MLLKKKRFMYVEQDGSIDNIAVFKPSNNSNSSSSNNINSSSNSSVVCVSGSSYGSNMADTREVRIVEQLKVKIGDAKNLSSRNAANTSCSTQGTRDVYCIIALDQEEICRSPIIERTLKPFFGEEYHFIIPRRFRYLSIYLYDRDMKQDKPIGKIAIKREELHKYNHEDHWFSLRPVDADSEVQGMAQIEVQFEKVPQPVTMTTLDVNKELGGQQHLHHQSAHQNDYKENSELSNIQRSLTGTSSSNDQLKEALSNTHARNLRVAIRVPACVDLSKKQGNCDPYVVFTAYYNNNQQITKRTKRCKKTVNPEFDEVMYFDLCINTDVGSTATTGSAIYPIEVADISEIVITVWHGAMADKIFLGEVRLPMLNKQQQMAVQPSAWYYLQPRSTASSCRSLNVVPRSCATPPGTRLSVDSTIGSLRLNLNYTADHVFPLATYDDLLNLLLESGDRKPITVSAVSILGELVSGKTELAQPLVRLFTYKERIASIIEALADSEISNLTDPTTIFRGNTLVSKMMEEAMRLSGLHYLHQTLRPVLSQIVAEKKPCEIDPSKVNRSAIDTNLHNLQDYVERVFEAITKSAERCPKVLCEIFYNLRRCASKHFPRNLEVRYSVVSGFIFLRFFAPAILGPKLFDLTTERLDAQTNRTLTLISKTIQSLGNLVSSRSSQQPCKEEYTGELYKKFCTEKHVEAVKRFLEQISTLKSDDFSHSEPVVLKEGIITKYPKNPKHFGNKSMQRYFCLTTRSLSYSNSKGKRPKLDIPLEDISSVEQLNDKSFKMQNCFKIISKDRPLIVQAMNCVEEHEWIELLHKICRINSIRMHSFHPSAFVSGIYSCCDRADENAPGCKTVSPQEMYSFQMDLVTALDPQLDLQRIHTLIMSNMCLLDALLDPLAQHLPPQHNPLGPMATALQQQSLTVYGEFKKTIEKLREKAYAIDRDHRDYKQGITRKLKYGSPQAPIGDDNYYSLMRAAGQLNLQHHQQQQYQQQQQQQQQQYHQQQQQYHQQQQQQHHQQPQPVLPQMQNVRANPYQAQQQHQQQQQLHHSNPNMNAYHIHNLQHQQRVQQQNQQQNIQQYWQQDQPLRSQQQLHQQLQLQRQHQLHLNNNIVISTHNNNNNNNSSSGHVSSSSPSSTASSVAAAPSSLASSASTSMPQPAKPIY